MTQESSPKHPVHVNRGNNHTRYKWCPVERREVKNGATPTIFGRNAAPKRWHAASASDSRSGMAGSAAARPRSDRAAAESGSSSRAFDARMFLQTLGRPAPVAAPASPKNICPQGAGGGLAPQRTPPDQVRGLTGFLTAFLRRTVLVGSSGVSRASLERAEVGEAGCHNGIWSRSFNSRWNPPPLVEIRISRWKWPLGIWDPQLG
eukprot:gene25047-biopygen19472